MFIVISYDIVEDHQRARVAKTLLDHGKRVQKSVFECVITERQFYKLKGQLEEQINLANDSIRFYRICNKCKQAVEVSGWGTVTRDPRKGTYII